MLSESKANLANVLKEIADLNEKNKQLAKNNELIANKLDFLRELSHAQIMQWNAGSRLAADKRDLHTIERIYAKHRKPTDSDNSSAHSAGIERVDNAAVENDSFIVDVIFERNIFKYWVNIFSRQLEYFKEQEAKLIADNPWLSKDFKVRDREIIQLDAEINKNEKQIRENNDAIKAKEKLRDALQSEVKVKEVGLPAATAGVSAKIIADSMAKAVGIAPPSVVQPPDVAQMGNNSEVAAGNAASHGSGGVKFTSGPG